jgi:Major Facilitator Superfamily
MPFQNKNYRLLWLANLLASFSGHVSMIAFPLVAVRHLGATAWDMGLLIAVEVLPFVLFSLPAGTLVDRYNTQRLVLVTFIALAAVTMLVPLAFTFGVLSMAWLYVAGFLIGAILCLEGTAAQVLTTELVSRKGLVEANAWMMGTESGLKLIAPAAGGMMVEAVGAATTLWCEVVLIGLASIVLSRIKHTGVRAKPAAAPMHALILEGLQTVWRTPVLRTAGGVVMIWQLLWHGVYALIVLYATRDLGFSATQLGLAVACGAAGVLMATLASGHVERRLGLGAGMLIGLGLAGVGWGLMAAVQPLSELAVANQGAIKFALFAAAYVVMDFGLTIGFVCYISLRQAVTADHILGRVVGTMRWLNLLLAPFGSIVFGALAHRQSTAVAMAVAAICCTVLAVAACFTLLWRVLPGVASGAEPDASTLHMPALGALNNKLDDNDEHEANAVPVFSENRAEPNSATKTA